MAHIVQQLLQRTRSHPFAAPPSIVQRAAATPATEPRRATSAPDYVHEQVRQDQGQYQNPGVVFHESSGEEQEDLVCSKKTLAKLLHFHENLLQSYLLLHLHEDLVQKAMYYYLLLH